MTAEITFGGTIITPDSKYVVEGLVSASVDRIGRAKRNVNGMPGENGSAKIPGLQGANVKAGDY
jgi:hypothetical protein